MANIFIPPRWRIPEALTTPESHVQNRRMFMRIMGYCGAGALAAGWLLRPQGSPDASELMGRSAGPLGPDCLSNAPFSPAVRNPGFAVDRLMTTDKVAARYNNFYEFTATKSDVWRLVGKFKPWPWQIEIAGLVEHPGIYDVEDLLRGLPQEERVYYFRCVERWAMVVPWTGVPLAALVQKLRPLSGARYLALTSFADEQQMPGLSSQDWYPWPYHEALTIEEATNELSLLATGIFGRALPKQHGAPIRLVCPWKYGFKNLKSLARIEFTEKKPNTFWNTLAPDEYDFYGNVNPFVPHPRWSQAEDTLIGTGEKLPTRLFNGYAAEVAHLYPDAPTTPQPRRG